MRSLSQLQTTTALARIKPRSSSVFSRRHRIRVPQRIASRTMATTSGGAVNAWSTPGSAAFDLRSDVVTRPTPSMLASVQATSLMDDVFAEDPTTNDLEAFIARLTRKPAALLVLSGTMGNQLALRGHLTQPPHAVLTDHRSHVLLWEAGGTAAANGAMVTPVVPRNGHHVTLEDVKRETVLGDEIHSCPTRVISLENTLGGMVTPLSDFQEISVWAKAQTPPIKLHLDGARLWEAVVAGHGSIEDYCACFDSVSLCFSKGLGAPIGSIVVGEESFVKRARWLRKSIGGGLHQSGVVAGPARVAVEETFLGGRLKGSHDRAREVASLWESKGGKLANPTETNMVWLDLEAAGLTKGEFMKICDEGGIKTIGGRLVVHYQIGAEAVAKLSVIFDKILTKGVEVDPAQAHEAAKRINVTVE